MTKEEILYALTYLNKEGFFSTASFVQLLILQTCKVEQDEFGHYRSSRVLEEPSTYNLEKCLASQSIKHSPLHSGINLFNLSFTLALSLSNTIY